MIDRSPEFGRVLLNDGEERVKLGQPLVTQVIGPDEIRDKVAEWLGEVREDGLCEESVALVGVLQRFRAILVVLEGGYRIRYNGV